MKPVTKRVWSWLRRVGPWALAGLVMVLVVQYAQEVDWPAVWQSLAAFPPSLLLLSAALALTSHGLYASFDVIGRHLTQHGLSRVRSWSIAAISFAFNLNFGALIGGLALRLRLYTRRGLAIGTVGQIAMYSIFTNWLGWCWVAGVTFMAVPPRVELEWMQGDAALRVLGAILVVVAIAYHGMCMRWGGETLTWREHSVTLPPLQISFLQAAMGGVTWLIMGLSICNLLGWRIDYPTALGVLLLAAVAGALTHVPAGLGVLEGVFVAALHGRLPASEILAAVLAYRAVHHILPLCLALPAYGLDEALARRQPA